MCRGQSGKVEVGDDFRVVEMFRIKGIRNSENINTKAQRHRGSWSAGEDSPGAGEGLERQPGSGSRQILGTPRNVDLPVEEFEQVSEVIDIVGF